MSDNRKNGLISGNLRGRSRSDTRLDKNTFLYTGRPLVEEWESVSMADIMNRFNRRELLDLAERGRAIRILHGRHLYEIMISAEHYQQKRSRSGWSDISRIWFLCSCGRRARRLYFDPRPSNMTPIFACRVCHRLRYLSQNSGKTRWFHEIVKPLRRLIRRHDKLLLRKRTQQVREELQFLERQIFILTQRAKPKGRSQRFSRVRRPYRNMRLVAGGGG